MKPIVVTVDTLAALAVWAVLALLAGMKAFGATASEPHIDQGAAIFASVCAACHAPDGNSLIPLNPKLAQQHPDYLIKQLTEFKAGKRVNPIMLGMAGTLRDDDIRNVAYWASRQKLVPGVAKNKELVLLGERIYRGGIQDRRVPACAGCHGPSGSGIPSQYPRLGGQHADYAVAQLTAFRDGLRQNSPTMTQVAATLNDREIRAVADYVAGLR